MGGITGALVGLGIPELESKRYEGKMKNGNVLIFRFSKNAGAEDISSTGEASAPKNQDATYTTRNRDKVVVDTTWS